MKGEQVFFWLGRRKEGISTQQLSSVLKCHVLTPHSSLPACLHQASQSHVSERYECWYGLVLLL